MPESPRIILIDGRSGSGKTELARSLVQLWPGYQLLRLDDLYPGWGGLDAGSAAVPGILRTHTWRSWDWDADAPGPWRDLDADRPLVVEGVGAISRASRPLAGAALWVELDAATRKHRALARDGDAFAAHWHDWAAQEERFIAREHPRDLADAVIDGISAMAALEAARVALTA
ncbi:AAA family ATPase [soil metagenome]